MLAAASSPAAATGGRPPRVPRLQLEPLGISHTLTDEALGAEAAASTGDSGFTFSSSTGSLDSCAGNGGIAAAWQWQDVPSPQWLRRSPSQ